MISPDASLVLIVVCLFLCSLICLGPFLASTVSCINFFLFLRALVRRFFSTNLLKHILPCLLVFSLFVRLFACLFVCLFFVLFLFLFLFFVFGRNSFLFLSKFQFL